MNLDVGKILSQDFTKDLFPRNRELLSNLNDIYELEIAFYENRLLSDEELIRNAAYFAKINEKYTRHFLMCAGQSLKLPDHSSSRLKSFFDKNIFRTGYATHGLFPYRGKFHPQMIKGLMNIMGLKPGQTVLDPMMGSGTVMVEACLMGIRSIGVDASPFCRFMAQTKIDALTMSLDRVRGALANYEEVYAYFQKKVGISLPGSMSMHGKVSRYATDIMEPSTDYTAGKDRLYSYHFLLLAYLDSAGYAERSNKKSPLDQFRAILERYLFVAEKIQRVIAGAETDLAEVEILEGDARALTLESSSVDGIIFSPPYSFAVDYLENDAFHLRFFGCDIERLHEKMIGLRGRTLAEKFRLYQEDMDHVLAECARVLKSGCFCTIIVGTNSNQLGKVMGVAPDEVAGLHEMMRDMGAKHGLLEIKRMSRPIIGISNTLRREYILIFQRE